MKVITENFKKTFLHSFIGGVGWGLGLTVGITIVGYLLSLLVNIFGGIPLIGSFLATIVSATLNALNGS